jgi:hypothetical protein
VDNYPSTSELQDLFLTAAETERKLPPAVRKQKMCSWPEYVQEWSAYGYSDFKAPLPKATPKEISEYDHALLLGIKHMDADDRRMVWAVSQSAAFRERGPQWHKLARLRGLADGRQVKRRYTDAIIRLYYKCKAADDAILEALF